MVLDRGKKRELRFETQVLLLELWIGYLSARLDLIIPFFVRCTFRVCEENSRASALNRLPASLHLMERVSTFALESTVVVAARNTFFSFGNIFPSFFVVVVRELESC